MQETTGFQWHQFATAQFIITKALDYVLGILGGATLLGLAYAIKRVRAWRTEQEQERQAHVDNLVLIREYREYMRDNANIAFHLSTFCALLGLTVLIILGFSPHANGVMKWWILILLIAGFGTAAFGAWQAFTIARDVNAANAKIVRLEVQRIKNMMDEYVESQRHETASTTSASQSPRSSDRRGQ